MRIAAPIVIVATLALLAGCGGSDNGTTDRATTGSGAVTRPEARAAFLAEPSCKRPADASRWGCSIPDYRCQAVVADRGWSVSCSRPGRSVGFLVRR